ncbi:MAG: hypothetical protein JXL97_03095 [Bacteroidales bacterium]|nr:hypothetical protein [Bacteroidales bacterium]
MSILKNISFFITALVVLISSSGINITEHTCTSCGIHDKNLAFIISYEHSHEHEKDAKIEVQKINDCQFETCCSSKHITESKQNTDKTIKCCDFNNEYLKILNLFSPVSNFEFPNTQILIATVLFNEILNDIPFHKILKINFSPLILQDFTTSLSKICKYLL